MSGGEEWRDRLVEAWEILVEVWPALVRVGDGVALFYGSANGGVGCWMVMAGGAGGVCCACGLCLSFDVVTAEMGISAG